MKETIFKDNWKQYRELGLLPLPSSRKSKSPIPKWKDVPTFEEKDFEHWGNRFSDTNIWVYLGPGFAVIDPDGPGAEEFVKSLNLPPCPTSISGNKSTHRWFKASSPIKSIKASNGGDKTFLEVRTGNMGMLAPPSIHPETGRPYRWAEGHSPWEIPFPEFPREAYDKIQSLVRKAAPPMEPPEANALPGKLDVAKYLIHHGVRFKIKPDGQRTIFALEKCLFAEQHTTKDVQGDSSIIQGPDGKLGYHCFHNHCAMRTWQDARQAISGEAPLAPWCHGYRPLGEAKDKNEKVILTLKQAVLDADQIRVMDFPEKKKILSPWLSEQTLVLVSGWRGAGKTWFALGLCDAISRKEDFGQWETVTSVPILYVDGEMAIQDVKERIQILSSSTRSPRENPLLIYSDFYGNSLGIPKANLLNHKWRNAIMDLCADWSIRLVVLDNLSSLCPRIDENSKAEWDPINQWLIGMRFNGISVIAVHHLNKEGDQRGTSAREDNIDISIRLEQPHDYTPEDGCRFILKFSKARIRTASLPLIQDTEFQLREENGQTKWTFSGTKKKNKVEVLRCFKDGIPQKEIPDLLKLSKGQVSKIKVWLVEQDYMTEGGAITVKGEGFLSGN